MIYPNLTDTTTGECPVSLEFERIEWFRMEVQPHESSLRVYLRGRYPDLRDVDDILQESFLRVWVELSRSRIRAPRCFLFTVARRLAIDWLRREGRSPFCHDSEALLVNVVDDIADPAAPGRIIAAPGGRRSFPQNQFQRLSQR